MTGTASQRWLIVLLATASVGTTTLIAMNVLRRPTHRPDEPTRQLRGGIVTATPGDTPPVLLTLAPFTLIDQMDQPFGSQQLRDKVWIADFIFTRCAGPCPMMTSRMAQLQDQLSQHHRRDEIVLVSITVDPEHDTPAVLQAYARLAHASDTRWRFLTGHPDNIHALVRSGFRLPVGTDSDNANNTNMPIFHSQKFALVDRSGRVRGYYDALTDEGRQELLTDLQRVVSEVPSATQHSRLSPEMAPDGSP